MMDINNPTVSIVLPTYNRIQTIPRAINSVLYQTYKDFELIVVDDGSTDNTNELIKQYADKRVKWFCLDNNCGAAVARNKGIELSSGRYIAFQDSDDEWLPQKLEKQMKVLGNSSEKLGFVYSDMLYRTVDGEEKYMQSPMKLNVGSVIDTSRLDYQAYLGPPATLVKKECFAKVGMFDARFTRFIDLDLFIRLAMEYPSCRIGEPLVIYHETKGSISASREASCAARLLLIDKYYEKIKNSKRFLSKQYSIISNNYYILGKKSEGRKYLFQSLKAYPLNYRVVVNFLKYKLSKLC